MVGTLGRRKFIGTTAVGTMATAVEPGVVLPGRSHAAKTLRILQSKHFVPRYDALPNMMANTVRGENPSAAVARARILTKGIFEKWRAKGFVGGAR